MLNHNKICSPVKFIAGVIAVVSLTSCAADKRSFADGWIVTSNQCGDVSATIRSKEQYEVSIQRELVMFDLQDNRIYQLNVNATRAGVGFLFTTYANDETNNEIDKRVIQRNSIQEETEVAIDTYYDEPGKHKEINYNCLFKGMPL